LSILFVLVLASDMASDACGLEPENLMANKEKEESFETCLAALEQVVDKIESGEMNLEESLATFEKGVHLVKTCNEKLNAVERRIELLTKDPEGKLQLSLLEDLEEDKESDE